MKPNIVILDDMELTDAQFQFLSEMGDLKVFTGVPQSDEEVINRAANADILILGWTRLTASIFEKLPRLKYIAVWATGFDYVDVVAAAQKNIPVSNVPGYAAESVAELTIGLMLSLSRKIPQAYEHVQKGGYSWKGFKGGELFGKTLGVVGVGNIGKRVVEIAKGFGMKTIAYTKNPSVDRSLTLGVEFVNLDDLLRVSDFVSLHVPLRTETENMIGKRELSLMKPTSFLINTTRWAVVNQKDLYTALNNKQIAGAGVDDLRVPDDEFLNLKNVVITPHMAFFTEEAIIRKTDICIENIHAYLSGERKNIVNL
ncbi:MAG: glycerate dehydrogenase [Bacteroidales bacterium]|nr:glycerate dehydrogenase [Bacteroidales bacterium]